MPPLKKLCHNTPGNVQDERQRAKGKNEGPASIYMNRAEPRLDSSPIDLRLQESAHTAEVAETGLLRLD